MEKKSSFDGGYLEALRFLDNANTDLVSARPTTIAHRFRVIQLCMLCAFRAPAALKDFTHK